MMKELERKKQDLYDEVVKVLDKYSVTFCELDGMSAHLQTDQETGAKEWVVQFHCGETITSNGVQKTDDNKRGS